MLASARQSSGNLNSAQPQDTVPTLPDTPDAVTAVIDAAKALVAPFRLDGPGLSAAISGNRLLVTGEIDIANAGPFRTALLALDQVPAATLILDLTGVSFLGGPGIREVADLAAHLTPQRRLVVECRRKTGRFLNMFTTQQQRAKWRLSIHIQEVL
jgi:hypothetical protein